MDNSWESEQEKKELDGSEIAVPPEVNSEVEESSGVSRRDFIKGVSAVGLVLGGSAFLAACGVNSSSTHTKKAAKVTPEAKVVYVRSLGGAYEAAWQKAAWVPFEKATGIRVVGVTSTPAQVLADAKAGRVTLDVLDLGESGTIQLGKENALAKIDQSYFTKTDLRDIVGPSSPYYLPSFAFSLVLGYNKRTLGSRYPRNWADFWDVSRYPGSRTLEGLSSGAVNLEQALLADGVPMDKIFPIDINRAFAKLTEIKSDIVTLWETGAQSAEVFTTNAASMGSVWNGRLQVPIEGGYPLAIEWNQAERLYQCFSIAKGAPHPENAARYIDFALQPKVLADFASGIFYGPSNKKSYEYISSATAANLPTSPEHLAVSFAQDANWWVQNFAEVSNRWETFVQ